MRNLTIALLLLVAGCVSPPPPEPVAKPSKITEYGEKSPDTITVIVNGSVDHLGRYHLKTGTTLDEVLAMAVMSENANGHVTVIRRVDGAVKFHDFWINRKQLPSLPDIGLLEGDIVYVKENVE